MGLDMGIYVNGKEAIYMEKANAIRRWCAENLEDFVDNGLTNFPKEKFWELIDTMLETMLRSGISALYNSYIRTEIGEDVPDFDLCTEAEAFLQNEDNRKKFVDIASDMFPTSSGFSFGSTEYDHYYIEDLIVYCDEFIKLYNAINEREEEWDEGTVEYWEWY